ncbi:hypothetical protein Fcan01_23007 [Folsomia candida]|uniref:Uncharacterized protein n=1 Tax=Folsomia candida TaxID=158441 RepID=A0A226DCA3_FOLCA|nr:hypothetical protein Fcan01_23007 [Folsomia candida]
MKLLMSRYTKYVIQEKKLGQNPLVTRYPWYMDNSEYTRLIKKGLAKLWESGIYKNWDTNFDYFRAIFLLRESDKRNNKCSMNYYGIFVMSGAGMVTGNEYESEFSPVKTDNLKLCFILFFVGVFCGVVCHFVEYCNHVFPRWMELMAFKFVYLP